MLCPELCLHFAMMGLQQRITTVLCVSYVPRITLCLFCFVLNRAYHRFEHTCICCVFVSRMLESAYDSCMQVLTACLSCDNASGVTVTSTTLASINSLQTDTNAMADGVDLLWQVVLDKEQKAKIIKVVEEVLKENEKRFHEPFEIDEFEKELWGSILFKLVWKPVRTKIFLPRVCIYMHCRMTCQKCLVRTVPLQSQDRLLLFEIAHCDVRSND